MSVCMRKRVAQLRAVSDGPPHVPSCCCLPLSLMCRIMASVQVRVAWTGLALKKCLARAKAHPPPSSKPVCKQHTAPRHFEQAV